MVWTICGRYCLSKPIYSIIYIFSSGNHIADSTQQHLIPAGEESASRSGYTFYQTDWEELMTVKGFKAAAIAAGLRYSERFDMGLIAADKPAAWAGVFTQSVCRAAPVIWSAAKAARGTGRAFLVNSGQSNAQTGKIGEEHCRMSAGSLSGLLHTTDDEIMLASTGIIGQPIKIEAMMAALPNLVAALRDTEQAFDDFSQAILTTDTRAKTASAEIELGGHKVSLWGCCKGSGMIAPNMATMLGFVLTDAAVAPELLQWLTKEGADLTFNRVSVDGDTSTNDSVMVMASGASGVTVEGGESLAAFKKAFFEVMKSLAVQIARDGEGATKLVTVRVRGAANDEEARKAARTVAESPLVKTAFHGCDANWGRICMAIGRSGAKFDPYAVDIDLDDVPWIRAGIDNGREEEATAVMQKKEYVVDINLGAGGCEYDIMTCDLSHEYVTINGSYRS
ncbi:ornithine acetyltransferase [Deltaproteobacteria bacterium Smac51]|nr:ornithine acetyltransferase [Deltaproteobacteria bacterium Smac51]